MDSDSHHHGRPLHRSVTDNARLGIWFFLLYFLFYAGFVFIVTFKYEWMGRPVLGGLNLAIVYGMGLIIMAFVLAVLYMTLCKSPPADHV